MHVFEALDQPRILDEPHSPPPTWWLPWLEFGMDDDVLAAPRGPGAGRARAPQVTPEIREAADNVLAGVQGTRPAPARCTPS